VSYLLDTCVLSEFSKKKPAPAVVGWMEGQPEEMLFTSAIVLGELARGVALLPPGSKKRQLTAWLHNELRQRFAERAVGICALVALKWGDLSGEAAGRGITVSMADGLIGATAIVHSMTVVTRNVDDLAATGARVLNPWEDA
jgi:toxin FitB